MAYCTEANVESEFKDVDFGTSTAITSSDVSDFIDQASAEIDGKLGLIYETPITGTTSLLIVKQICINLVAGRIKKILEVKTGASEADQGSADDAQKIARDMLEQIIDNKISLPDATRASAADGVKSYVNDNSSTISSIFERDTNQW